jgi:hypothetical protein
MSIQRRYRPASPFMPPPPIPAAPSAEADWKDLVTQLSAMLFAYKEILITAPAIVVLLRDAQTAASRRVDALS